MGLEEDTAGNTGRWKWLIFTIIMLAAFFMTLEFGLRAVKSLMMDGTFHVRTPSINNELHRKYGWISPASVRFHKNDACYGSGAVSYNEAGFRAPPLADAGSADLTVCILGDSTMQGYQLPDGAHLPHQLAAELEESYDNPYVLPLAVGGFGSVQEWMLFEDFCRDLNPDVVIWHWDSNDIKNNNYFADRYSGPNNVRPRPYFEDGAIVIRRPYPIRIDDRVDSMMTFKMLNGVILRATAKPEDQLEEYRENGWSVASEMVRRVGAHVDHRVALLDRADTRAIEMFKRLNYEIAIYDSFSEDLMCLPKDDHPTAEGHERMLNALRPVLARVLKENDAEPIHQ